MGAKERLIVLVLCVVFNADCRHVDRDAERETHDDVDAISEVLLPRSVEVGLRRRFAGDDDARWRRIRPLFAIDDGKREVGGVGLREKLRWLAEAGKSKVRWLRRGDDDDKDDDEGDAEVAVDSGADHHETVEDAQEAEGDVQGDVDVGEAEEVVPDPVNIDEEESEADKLDVGEMAEQDDPSSDVDVTSAVEFPELTVNISVVNANFSNPACISKGVCRFTLGENKSGVELPQINMCYYFATGLVGQCTSPSSAVSPCEKETVVACHPFPHLAEAIFGTFPVVGGGLEIILPDGATGEVANEQTSWVDPAVTSGDALLLSGLRAARRLARDVAVVVADDADAVRRKMAHVASGKTLAVGVTTDGLTEKMAELGCENADDAAAATSCVMLRTATAALIAEEEEGRKAALEKAVEATLMRIDALPMIVLSEESDGGAKVFVSNPQLAALLSELESLVADNVAAAGGDDVRGRMLWKHHENKTISVTEYVAKVFRVKDRLLKNFLGGAVAWERTLLKGEEEEGQDQRIGDTTAAVESASDAKEHAETVHEETEAPVAELLTESIKHKNHCKVDGFPNTCVNLVSGSLVSCPTLQSIPRCSDDSLKLDNDIVLDKDKAAQSGSPTQIVARNRKDFPATASSSWPWFQINSANPTNECRCLTQSAVRCFAPDSPDLSVSPPCTQPIPWCFVAADSTCSDAQFAYQPVGLKYSLVACKNIPVQEPRVRFY